MTRAPEYADPERYIELVGFKGTWRDLFWNRDFLDLMARRLRLERVRDALDVGCGAGHWTRAVLPHLPAEARLTGVDREPAFLELARAQSDPTRAQFVMGEAEKLPFDDASFDLVTCQLLLIHVKDAEVAIAEMIRVLRPGGVLLAAEPDNRAGNLALLGGEPRVPDEDVLAIMGMILRCDRGKEKLGEGNQNVGSVLPGLFAAAGLEEVLAHTNDRAISLYPPYERADMRVAIEQELAWAREDVSILVGSRSDNLRFFVAAGGTDAEFDVGWAATLRWLRAVEVAIARRDYHAARGFVMYLVGGRKPRAR